MRLERRFDEVERAARAEDVAGACLALAGALGLTAGEHGTVRRLRAVAVPPLPRVGHLRYDVVREIDVVALVHGARDLAKFEDLDEGAASMLATRLAGMGLDVALGQPYAKRFDALESRSSTVSERPLRALAASRTPGRAATLLELERDRSADGTRRAGAMLGYPPCCVEAFVAVTQTPDASRDGVNEAAVRLVLDGRPLPWRAVPLATCSAIGFAACGPRCGAALRFADRLLAALGRDDAAALATTRRLLSRPVLFFRWSVFFVFDGATRAEVDGAVEVRYASAFVNDDGARSSALDRTLDALLADAVAMGDRLRVSERALEVYAGATRLVHFEIASPAIPRLVWPELTP